MWLFPLIRSLTAIVLFLAVAYTPTIAGAGGSASGASLTGDQVFQLAEHAVYRLVTKVPDSASPRSSGTAFAVNKSGYLVTNYHVITDAVLAPDRYQLFLEMREGQVLATIENIDVVNDLALIRVPRDLPQTLTIANELQVSPGETIYSMGFPLTTEKLFLTQGNFSGMRVMGLVPALLASIPLNSGMSGGPTMDAKGRVIGVNRAVAARSQNISFLTPLPALKRVLSSSSLGRAPAVRSGWKEEIARQVKAQEKKSLSESGRFSRFKRDRVGDFSFMIPLADLACGQDKARKEDPEMLSCRTQSLTFLDGGQVGLSVATSVIGQMPAQVRQIQNQKIDKSYSSALAAYNKRDRGPASEKKPDRCGFRYLRNKAGIEMTVRYCSVLIRQFPGLFSTFLKVEIDQPDGLGLSLSQEYQGMSLATTSELMEDLLESIQRVRP